MWLTKKSKDKWILNNKEEVLRILYITIPEKKSEAVKEKPKPTTRKALMEITVINNKTDKEYIIKSENDFGLKWEIGQKEANYQLLIINQNHSTDDRTWTGVSRFLDFSVISTIFKTFDIKPEEQENK